MIYEKATAEVILFDNSDVITTSGIICGQTANNPPPPECGGNGATEGWWCTGTVGI